ncbi:MAG: isocitrate lyase/PEP mutase family protein [Alphaproteobacteria bacterium]|jgi:methylisocitrate lyase|nr:isocitrate lyase/PEP mutase family protein [Alphaproteobacteria bacterium]MDP6812867.1 isocitrate lyase/PEP mutase family protein [Alphaproteobacteria bacterium]
MTDLRTMMAADEPVCAPLVLNPLMAKMAEQAGFRALYLGGGASGYLKVHLEANLSLTEMCQAGIEIRAASELPLILDAAAGWGDPMHIHRTMGMAEAAGFAAIEIEDQILPKRAHHHVGTEHMVPLELMVAKVREAVAVRRDPQTVIIARSNGVRASDLDDALRRAEAYKAAGADALLLSPRTAEEARQIGERLPEPLMLLLPAHGVAALDLTAVELRSLGYCLLVTPVTPLLAAYEAMRAVYAELADGFAIRSRPVADWQRLQDELHDTIGLEDLLAVERRTVEPPGVTE